MIKCWSVGENLKFDSGDMEGVITDREGLISTSKVTKAIGGGLD